MQKQACNSFIGNLYTKIKMAFFMQMHMQDIDHFSTEAKKQKRSQRISDLRFTVAYMNSLPNAILYTKS